MSWQNYNTRNEIKKKNKRKAKWRNNKTLNEEEGTKRVWTRSETLNSRRFSATTTTMMMMMKWNVRETLSALSGRQVEYHYMYEITAGKWKFCFFFFKLFFFGKQTLYNCFHQWLISFLYIFLLNFIVCVGISLSPPLNTNINSYGNDKINRTLNFWKFSFSVSIHFHKYVSSIQVPPSYSS